MMVTGCLKVNSRPTFLIVTLLLPLLLMAPVKHDICLIILINPCPGSSCVHHITIFNIVVVVVITTHRGPVCSPHGNIYTASTTSARCPPFERQGVMFKHHVDICVAWHKLRKHGCTSACCQLVLGQHLMVGNDNVSSVAATWLVTSWLWKLWLFLDSAWLATNHQLEAMTLTQLWPQVDLSQS